MSALAHFRDIAERRGAWCPDHPLGDQAGRAVMRSSASCSRNWAAWVEKFRVGASVRIRARAAGSGRRAHVRGPSNRVHGRYERLLADVAHLRPGGVTRPQVRRPSCGNDVCPGARGPRGRPRRELARPTHDGRERRGLPGRQHGKRGDDLCHAWRCHGAIWLPRPLTAIQPPGMPIDASPAARKAVQRIRP